MGFPIEEVKKSVERTGFGVELRVVQELQKQGWNAQHSLTYEDKDELKNREIDVLAVKRSSPTTVPIFRFGFHVVAEAKHADRPWVCFSTKQGYKRSPWSIVHASSTRDSHSEERKGEWLPVLSGDCAQDEFLRKDFERIAKAFHPVGGSDSDGKNSIVGGLRQVTKAVQFFADQIQKEHNQSVSRPLNVGRCDVFHPILVFDNELYEVYLDETENERYQLREWMPAELTYSSPHYRKGMWGDSYFPDIVTLKALPQYLKKVEEWRTLMEHRISIELNEQIGNLPKRPKSGIRVLTSSRPQGHIGTNFKGR